MVCMKHLQLRGAWNKDTCSCQICLKSGRAYFSPVLSRSGGVVVLLCRAVITAQAFQVGLSVASQCISLRDNCISIISIILLHILPYALFFFLVSQWCCYLVLHVQLSPASYCNNLCVHSCSVLCSTVLFLSPADSYFFIFLFNRICIFQWYFPSSPHSQLLQTYFQYFTLSLPCICLWFKYFLLIVSCYSFL